MSAQQWGTPETGVYFLRYAGHDLEVRRIPKRGNGAPEKQYQVIINGTLADMAWSTTEAKTKSIKYAERSHKGQPILSYSERANGSDSQLAANESGDLVAQPSAAPAPQPALSHEPAIPASSLIDGFSQVPCGCQADQEARIVATEGVSFSIAGKLTMDATDALVTIRAAVELLREHGIVDCNAIVPNSVTL